MKRSMEFFYSPTRATSVSAFGANEDTLATLLVNASPPGATISMHLTILLAEYMPANCLLAEPVSKNPEMAFE